MRATVSGASYSESLLNHGSSFSWNRILRILLLWEMQDDMKSLSEDEVYYLMVVAV